MPNQIKLIKIVIYMAKSFKNLFFILLFLITSIFPLAYADILGEDVGAESKKAMLTFLIGMASTVLLVAVALFAIKYFKHFISLNATVKADPEHVETGSISDLAKDASSAETLKNMIKGEVKKISDKYEAIIKDKDVAYSKVEEKFKTTFQEKKQTESIVRSLSEGLIVLNEKGEVLMMNPAAENILDINKSTQMGKPLKSAIKKEQLLSLAEDKEGKGYKEIELNAQNEETKKIIRSSTAVIEDENGHTIGMVSMLSDITKQKELDKLKDNFVCSVTHELRAPIVAMRNSITIMLDGSAGPVSENQRKFLEIAERNLKRLNLLINDLLDIAKLEAGRMEIKPEPASIKKVIDEAVEMMNSWAKNKGITISAKAPEKIPEANFDANRIIQVITNIVGNAIKFTPKNGFIYLEAEKSPENNEIIVGISDTGPGIGKEDKEKVFDKFYQITSDNLAGGSVGGTGLGLAICKEIIELHGGRIWVESETGQGAKFIFTLPVSGKT